MIKTGRKAVRMAAQCLAALCVFSAFQAAAQTSPVDESTLANPAMSDWAICNDTSYIVRVASAFTRDTGMTAKGWSEIISGECLTQSVPTDSPRFIFAESLAIHQGGIREWKGETSLCVSRNDFELDAADGCEAAGHLRRDFVSVRPGEPETRLREPGDYSSEAARIAVMQRLLRDAGYPISRVDGLSGRATTRLLRQFRRDAELDSGIEEGDLIRALIEKAESVNETTGFEVCNDGTYPIWSAIATRQSGNWRSRGWWQTEPGRCSKLLTRPLPGTEAHIYAIQGQDDGPDKRLRTVSTDLAQFCISEAQFDALGNELCVEQGYAIASFRAVPTDADGARMRLTDADFAEPNRDGLRR